MPTRPPPAPPYEQHDREQLELQLAQLRYPPLGFEQRYRAHAAALVAPKKVESMDDRCFKWNHHMRIIHHCDNPQCPSGDPKFIDLRSMMQKGNT